MVMHYIGFSTAFDETEQYQGNIAGNLKMHYIAQNAKRSGYDVQIFSLCKTAKKGYQKAYINNSEEIPIRHICSVGSSNILLTIFNRILFYLQLAMYVIFHVEDEDTVIVYHSMRITNILYYLSKLKRCPFILEVEEIYACAANGLQPYFEKEIDQIKRYNQFIFVNDYIPKYLKCDPSQYIVVYGAYEKVKEYPKYADGKIHAVYAGAIETLNRGAFKAIEAAQHTSENVVMHIIGKGTAQDMRDALEQIRKVNERLGYEKIRYDGFLSGEELDRYLSACHIGLGAYSIKDNYSNFIFPSKLLSYMVHNLKVVTGRSACYEESKIAEDWYLFDSDDNECIAKAIDAAASDQKEISNQALIETLDSQLVQYFQTMKEKKRWYNEE